MTHRQSLPVLDQPKPAAPRVTAGEHATVLVVHRCAMDGCKRMGNFLLEGIGWCECCLPVAIVGSLRCRR